MAQITFTISAENLAHLIAFYGRDYDTLVLSGGIDGEAVTKAKYAKDEAFKFLATPVGKWHKQQQADALPEIDITK